MRGRRPTASTSAFRNPGVRSDSRRRRRPPTGNDPALSVFDGTSPQGTWRLFAQDAVRVAPSTTVEDWTLDIEYVEKVAPSGSVSIAGGAAGHPAPGRSRWTSVGQRPPAGLGDQRRAAEQRRDDVLGVPVLRRHRCRGRWLPGDGTKTVYAQFRDADGNLSPVVSDTIVLDTTGADGAQAPPPGVAPTTSRRAPTIKMW